MGTSACTPRWIALGLSISLTASCGSWANPRVEAPGDALEATFAADEAISAERLGTELAARAGKSAAREVAFLVAGALITRCDQNRDGLLRTASERQCLSTLTLDDAWPASVTAVLQAPKAIAEPGWLLLLILGIGIVVVVPWAVDRSSRVAGWRLQRYTAGAWFRLWSPVRWLVALTAGVLVFFVVLLVLLWFGVASPTQWSTQWRQYYALAWFPIRALSVLTLVMTVKTAMGLGDTAKRLQGLLSNGTEVVDVPPRTTPKNILICCDGTGNQAHSLNDGRRAVSNVRKLFEIALSAVESGWTQETWYDDGVGTGTSGESGRLSTLQKAASWVSNNTPAAVVGIAAKFRTVLELGTGVGITENIAQAYAQVVRSYLPGDRIFIVGFSRGAYTARCVAAVIEHIGLLRSEHLRFAPDIIQLYRYRTGVDVRVSVRPELLHANARVEFLGVWDTVASLGVPLWGWSFSIGKLFSNAGFGASSLPQCRYIRHALSMDEQRSQFFPTLFDQSSSTNDANGRKRIEQRWFRGSHAGVGGGYADTSMSDIALRWMVAEAHASGLKIHANWEAEVVTRPDQGFDPNPLARIITELDKQKAWRVSGTWPRWHACSTTADDGFGVIDQTVMDRATHARSLRGNSEPVSGDELLTLAPGESATVVLRADRAWNRTGVVFERDGVYRVRYVSGQWRDKEDPPCGPAGQRATGMDIRRLFNPFKRQADGQWMELVGHVAHPRDWDQREHYGRQLLYYLLINDPIELTQSLIPLGRHLTTAVDADLAAAVDVEMQAPSGVFWGYANDAALFYDNNSGEVTLKIERLPNDHAVDRPRYVVTGPKGEVRRRNVAV